MPAMTTKFCSDDKLDLGLFNKNLDFQLKAGIDAVVLGGSLGEASTLTQNEKNILTQNTVDFVRNKIPVVVNIAEQSTKDALESVKCAEKFGASGLMVLPPMRYKSGENETISYFEAIANSTNLPIMIYNNPVDYGIEVTIGMFEKLLKCDNIKAVKESTRDISNVTRLKNNFGSRLKIMTGVDTIALEKYPDSHICRKYDDKFAKKTSNEASDLIKILDGDARLESWGKKLMSLDNHYKMARVNPGTTADLLVVSIMIYDYFIGLPK